MLKFLYVKSSRNAQVLSRCLTIGRDGKFIQNGRLRYVIVRPVREPASSQKGRATIAAKKKTTSNEQHAVNVGLKIDILQLRTNIPRACWR